MDITPEVGQSIIVQYGPFVGAIIIAVLMSWRHILKALLSGRDESAVEALLAKQNSESATMNATFGENMRLFKQTNELLRAIRDDIAVVREETVKIEGTAARINDHLNRRG